MKWFFTYFCVKLKPVLLQFTVLLRVNEEAHETAGSIHNFSSLGCADEAPLDPIVPPPSAYSLEINWPHVQQKSSPNVAKVDRRVESLRDLLSLFQVLSFRFISKMFDLKMSLLMINAFNHMIKINLEP